MQEGARLSTGGQSSNCEIVILQDNSHGETIRVCMGIFTTAPRNKNFGQLLTETPHLTSLLVGYLTVYYIEGNPF